MLMKGHANGWVILFLALPLFLQFLPHPFLSLIAPCPINTLEDIRGRLQLGVDKV